jgi:heptosyltransferase-2
VNIAVFLPNWVGDAVMATPALRALRNHFHHAHILAVLKPYVAGVLEGGDLVDELLYCQSVAGTAWKLTRRKIDLAVLFPNSFRSALIAWLGRCQRRIGYARQGRSWLLSDALPPVVDRDGRITPSPILDAYNQLAICAGTPPPGHEMELFTTSRDESAADAIWEQSGLCKYAEVVCLNPGAAFGAAKFWPAEYFAHLARELAQKRGCGVLVLCGPAERPICRQIVHQAGLPQVVGLHDAELSLGLTKACIRRADLLVTTDSGPRHFAAAFGRRVVTLFGPTHIAWTETYHPLAVHLHKPVECGPCQQRVCPLGHHRCMRELMPETVLNAALRLLAWPAPGWKEQRHTA